jgi:hypothetical protein
MKIITQKILKTINFKKIENRIYLNSKDFTINDFGYYFEYLSIYNDKFMN